MLAFHGVYPGRRTRRQGFRYTPLRVQIQGLLKWVLCSRSLTARLVEGPQAPKHTELHITPAERDALNTMTPAECCPNPNELLAMTSNQVNTFRASMLW